MKIVYDSVSSWMDGYGFSGIHIGGMVTAVHNV